jgi:hypothetical protein
MKKGYIKSMKPEIVLALVMGSISATAKLHLFGKVPPASERGHSLGWNFGLLLRGNLNDHVQSF